MKTCCINNLGRISVFITCCQKLFRLVPSVASDAAEMTAEVLFGKETLFRQRAREKPMFGRDQDTKGYHQLAITVQQTCIKMVSPYHKMRDTC